jgi:hypothetical protein
VRTETIDPELAELVRTSVRQALVSSSDDIAGALGEFGFEELVATDEAFASTTLFEEQGRLGADTPALDVVTVLAVGAPAGAHVVWPLDADAGAADASDRLELAGIALAPVDDRSSLLVPAAGSLHLVAPETLEALPAGGMARDSSWRRVRVAGRSESAFGSWPAVEHRARLAVASEIVGLTQRMLEAATEQVSERKQFGRPVGTYQAVRHRLAEAYSELAGARSLVAMAWEDGRPDAAIWAKTVASTAHATVAKHALQVCGAIGLHEEHPLPRLVRRGFALDALLGTAQSQRARLGAGAARTTLPEPVGTY